ncbi:unnamed protein product [Lampetra planeri]
MAAVYCVCRLPYDVTRFMIECDVCKDWFHGSCVGVEEHQAVDIDLYHCPNCAKTHGSSLMKKRKNWHRHDYTEGGATGKPVQTGTPVFVKKLQGRSFPSAEEVVRRMPGSQLTADYIIENGFTSPIIVSKKDGLGMTVPPPSFTVSDVERYVGSDRMIDVIDVNRQADFKVTMKEFCEYYNSTSRQKVLNIISLEFSDTRLSDLVKAPELVHKLSWVENYWPEDAVFPRPYVQKYCLMGVRDSYTDFHIDFGGTSVWYHLLKGEKIFYLIKPSSANLARYERWSSSPNQSEVFFGDLVDKCYKCVLKQGQTLFLPTGWIHAVLTPYDCIAFGGNFLHSLNVEMQIRAYDIETRLKTPEVFKFPNFESMCWYAGKSLLEMLKEMREDGDCPRTHVMQGARSLLHAFRAWTQKENVELHEREIPDNLRPGQLIKELGKELQLGEGSFRIKIEAAEKSKGKECSRPIFSIKKEGCGRRSGSGDQRGREPPQQGPLRIKIERRDRSEGAEPVAEVKAGGGSGGGSREKDAGPRGEKERCKTADRDACGEGVRVKLKIKEHVTRPESEREDCPSRGHVQPKKEGGNSGDCSNPKVKESTSSSSSRQKVDGEARSQGLVHVEEKAKHDERRVMVPSSGGELSHGKEHRQQLFAEGKAGQESPSKDLRKDPNAPRQQLKETSAAAAVVTHVKTDSGQCRAGEKRLHQSQSGPTEGPRAEPKTGGTESMQKVPPLKEQAQQAQQGAGEPRIKGGGDRGEVQKNGLNVLKQKSSENGVKIDARQPQQQGPQHQQHKRPQQQQQPEQQQQLHHAQQQQQQQQYKHPQEQQHKHPQQLHQQHKHLQEQQQPKHPRQQQQYHQQQQPRQHPARPALWLDIRTEQKPADKGHSAVSDGVSAVNKRHVQELWPGQSWLETQVRDKQQQPQQPQQQRFHQPQLQQQPQQQQLLHQQQPYQHQQPNQQHTANACLPDAETARSRQRSGEEHLAKWMPGAEPGNSAFGGGGLKRPKKGMATAKQRLGKILKLHKNGRMLL